MKTIPFITLGTSLGAFLMSPALAIEAPVDNSPPPPEPGTKKVQPVEQKRAFLGVVTSEVPEMFAEHLQITPGDGVVVRAVIPKSPADQGGISVNDIITRINDKPIGSSLELTREVGELKPGDKARVGLIQKGKASVATVELAMRPEEFALNDQAAPLDQLNLDGIPDGLADRIRDMIEDNVAQFDMPQGMNMPGMGPEMEDMHEAVREMQLRMQRAVGALNEVAPGNHMQFKNSTTIRLMDDEGSIEVKSDGESREVTIRDKDNAITWEGPWDTEQDKAAAPERIRKRLEGMDLDTNRMKLQFDR